MSPADEVEYLLLAALQRRQLSQSQKAALVVELEPVSAVAGGGASAKPGEPERAAGRCGSAARSGQEPGAGGPVGGGVAADDSACDDGAAGRPGAVRPGQERQGAGERGGPPGSARAARPRAARSGRRCLRAVGIWCWRIRPGRWRAVAAPAVRSSTTTRRCRSRRSPRSSFPSRTTRCLFLWAVNSMLARGAGGHGVCGGSSIRRSSPG